MGNYNGRQIQPDLDELEFNSDGELIVSESNIDVSEFSGFPIVNSELQNSSIDVAGNNVALGSSTTVNYTDLNDTGTSFPIQNSDLNNSSVQIAGNNVALGSSASVASTDLSDSNSIDANTLQGNQPSDLQEKVDGLTVSRNASSELQSVQTTNIFGDFENGGGTVGDWTINSSTGGQIFEGSDPYKGSKSIQFDYDGPDGSDVFVEIVRDIDFSSLTELSFEVTSISSNSDVELRLEVDSTTEYSKNLNNLTTGTVSLTDLENVTGVKTVKIGIYTLNNNSNYGSVNIDWITGLNPSEFVKNVDNGSGGTNEV